MVRGPLDGSVGLVLAGSSRGRGDRRRGADDRGRIGRGIGATSTRSANPDEVRVRHLGLDLAVDFDRKELRGTATLRSSVSRAPGRAPLVLDSRGLTIETVEAGRGAGCLAAVDPRGRPGRPDPRRADHDPRSRRGRPGPGPLPDLARGRGLAVARPGRGRPAASSRSCSPSRRRSRPGPGSRSRTRRASGSPTRRRSACPRA